MSSTVGRQIRLFLVDGSPAGLVAAEIMNWTGHVLVIPRSQMIEAINREEAGRTGIYFLIGDDPDQPTMQRLYIGEADCVADRIKQHSKDEAKDFWNRAGLITSKDHNLTKGHVRYLESRMIEIAKKAGRTNIANGTSPTVKNLPDGDIADMEFFLEQLQVVLPVVGFDFLKGFSRREPLPKNANDIEGGLFTIQLELNHRSGIHAEAAITGDELTVFQGSTALTEEFVSNGYAELRAQLMKEQKLIQKPGTSFLEFGSDVAFSSPSAASSVILNRNSNGRFAWKMKGSNQSLKEWEASLLEQTNGRLSVF